MTTVPTVHQAWSAVMNDVRAIEKGDMNKDQGFRFRGIDAVMDVVGPALRAHGVMIIPDVADVETTSYETKRGTQMVNRMARMNFRVYGPAGDYFDGCTYGEAADAGDKAVTKAQSVALRVFLLQALMVPTGDPDPDSSSHERAANQIDWEPSQRARCSLLEATKPLGWTDQKLVARYRADYSKDLLRELDVSAIEGFKDALIAEANAEQNE